MVAFNLRRYLVVAIAVVGTSSGVARAQHCSDCEANRNVIDLNVALQPVPDPGSRRMAPAPEYVDRWQHEDRRHDEYRHAQIERAGYEQPYRRSRDDDRDDDRREHRSRPWNERDQYVDTGACDDDRACDVRSINDDCSHEDYLSANRWNERQWREEQWSNRSRWGVAESTYPRTAWASDRYERRSYDRRWDDRRWDDRQWDHRRWDDYAAEARVPHPDYLEAPRFASRYDDSYGRDYEYNDWRRDNWRQTAYHTNRSYDDSYYTRPYRLHDRWCYDDDADCDAPSAALVWQTMGGCCRY